MCEVMSGHTQGMKKGKFCAKRKSNCGHSRYKKVCEPKPLWKAPWSRYDAHHLLCVASVTQFIGKKKELQPIIKQTDWCINKGRNLIAMPVWGQTISWYCTRLAKGQQLAAPDFANLPQHNYNHTGVMSFMDEVDSQLLSLADQIEKNKANHKAASAELGNALNGLSDYFKGELERRGSKRCGGTHAAWKAAFQNKPGKSEWYKPFSMANDGCEDPRLFPGLTQSKAKNILKNVAKFW